MNFAVRKIICLPYLPNMNLRTTFCLSHLLLFTLFLQAQQFGGTAPSVKWKQINNDTLRVIFPAGLDSQAKQVADISLRLSRETVNSIGNTIRKINIVLQNQTVISNGYVGLGPF